jgi:hypothetical protein
MFLKEELKTHKDKRIRHVGYTRGPWESERKLFTWSRFFKLCLYHGFPDISNSTARAYGNDFKSVGVTADLLLQFTRVVCPEEVKRYEHEMGKELQANIVYHRFHKMFSRHKGRGRGCAYGISREHPDNWRADCREEDEAAALRVRMLWLVKIT